MSISKVLYKEFDQLLARLTEEEENDHAQMDECIQEIYSDFIQDHDISLVFVEEFYKQNKDQHYFVLLEAFLEDYRNSEELISSIEKQKIKNIIDQIDQLSMEVRTELIQRLT